MSRFLNCLFYKRKDETKTTILSRLSKFSLTKSRKEEILPSENPIIPLIDASVKVENTIKLEEKIDVVVPVPVSAKEETKPKLDLISPRQPDTLFWCLFIIANGYDEYLEIDRNYGVKELEIKKKVNDFIFANSYKFKSTNTKVTKIAIQEIMSQLLTSQKETSILALVALTVYYNFNIILVDSKEKLMLEFKASVDVDLPTYVLYKDSYGKYKVNIESLTEEKLVAMKEKMFCLESYLKPLKSSSNYKVDELEALAKKMGVFDVNKKYKKPQLYEEVFAACTW